jgi:hypothetical protein
MDIIAAVLSLLLVVVVLDLQAYYVEKDLKINNDH